jgi:alkylation response protein AidB-like acyl-CoA dehydrogenase
METKNPARQLQDRKNRLLADVANLVPDMQYRALDLDRSGDFPRHDIELLRRLGALAAPLPTALGGLGMGTEPEGEPALLKVLRLLGRGNLCVGRLYEGHVNALRLIVRYGTAAQARSAGDAALAGHLFGLWATDAPDMPLRITAEAELQGAKVACSGAGHATRALVTARPPRGEACMLVVRLAPGERADVSGWDPHGMRATASGRVTLDGLSISAEDLIGEPGAYLRQPDFSAGAWRTSAVTLGGLEALVAEMRSQLVARGRHDAPSQRARIGEALMAEETVRLWICQAARLAETNDADPADVANYVNLARLAAESACLDAIRVVQRALGLAAFQRGTLAELLFRDLATYLRQPAPDGALAEAAAHFTHRDLPPLPETSPVFETNG